MKWIFGLLFLLINAFNTVGQQPAYFIFGEKEFEGIDIYNLIQDNDYNYWFATDQGIIKHDGYSFKSIECNSMKSNVVFNFIKDKKGVIYCHNLNHQIFKIEKGNCSLFFEIPEKGSGADIYLATSNKDELIVVSKEAYAINSKGKIISSTEKIKHNYIGQPFLLKDGRILCSQSTIPNIILYSNGKFIQSRLKLETAKKIKNILEFYRIGQSCFAVNLESKSFFQLDEKELKLKKELITPFFNKNEHLRYYSANNLLWVASNINGVTVLDKELKSRFNSAKIFKDFFISKVYKDSEGNILLATFDKGIIIIPNLKMLNGKSEFHELTISKIKIQDQSNVFLGTDNGSVYQFSNGQKKELSTLGNKSIDALFKWKSSPFILFDNDGLTIQNIQSKKKSIFSNIAFKCAAEKSHNEIYIGSNLGLGILNYNSNGNTFNYHPVPLLPYRVFDLIRVPNSNNLCIASIEGVKILKDNNKLVNLKFNDSLIYASSLFASNGKLFIVSKKYGFFIFHNGKITNYLTPTYKGEKIHFLKFRMIKNTIYASTNIGFVRLNINGKNLKILDKSVGLINNKMIDFETVGNTIWLSTSNGVQEIDLNSIKFKFNRPILKIAKIEVNNEKVVNARNFHSSEKKFSFFLASPSIKNIEHIYYHYKLLPNDENWEINKYENNRVTYNSLEPGSYTFVVKAENNGVFSNTKTFSFTIDSPFYQKWWFNLCGSLILILIIVLFYKRKLKKQELKAQLLNELNASKLIAIQSQMNPHFIFNSLNSIQDLVLKGDVTNSYTFITKFSNLVRRTLNYSDKDFIDFEQEVKLLELYLSLEKLRFKETLEIDFDSARIDDIQIPPMLIQPFIENALIHGLLHKEGLKKLKIDFKLIDDTLICEISDNGVGREKAKEIKERQRSEHESFAIGAIKKRFEILEKHFNGKLGFEYVDLKNEDEILGTKVIIRIPIIHKF
jgi:ligand-binding sensor domain-containing protein